VLEVGRFEGPYTIALSGYGAKVIGIENVGETMLRTWSFGFEATAFKCDVEQEAHFTKVPEVDITRHIIGVLHHLVDPVTHRKKLLARARKVILLDNHCVLENEATKIYHVGGVDSRYKHFREGGREETFAGMHDHAKWLPLDTLVPMLNAVGFSNVDVAELRDERNGPRTLMFAHRD